MKYFVLMLSKILLIVVILFGMYNDFVSGMSMFLFIVFFDSFLIVDFEEWYWFIVLFNICKDFEYDVIFLWSCLLVILSCLSVVVCKFKDVIVCVCLMGIGLMKFVCVDVWYVLMNGVICGFLGWVGFARALIFLNYYNLVMFFLKLFE